MAGLAYSYWFPPFAFDASLLYTYVTDGVQQTNLGDIFDYNFVLSYRIGGGDPGVFYGEQPSYRWDLIAELNGEWQDDVTVAGIKRPHGRNVVYFSPGVRLSGKKHWSAALSFGVPVVTRLNGPQAEPDYRVIGTVGFSF